MSLIILFPFILAFILLIKFKFSADRVAIISWLLIVIFAVFLFDTTFYNSLLYSWAGIIDSMKITLMVGTTIFLITLMQENGALKRITVFFKTTTGDSRVFQILFLCFGLGAFLVSLGATPVSMLPPIMLALGFDPITAVALPSIGYDPLTTFALLSIPAVVFFQALGSFGISITLAEAGLVFALFMPVISTGIAFGMLYIAKEPLLKLENITLALISGLTAGFVAIWVNILDMTTLTGVFAGLAICLSLIITIKIRGKNFIDRSVLTNEDIENEKTMSLLLAFSPWLILLIFSAITNLIPDIKNYLFEDLALPVQIGGIIKDTRFFWQAYLWVTVTIGITLIILPSSKKIVKNTVKTGFKRSYKPMITSALFFAVGFVLNYSAMTPDMIINKEVVPVNNMISILSTVTADLVGPWFPLIVPFIGLFAGFVTGSETSAIVTFSKFHHDTSTKLGLSNYSSVVINASNGIGGGLASVITPAKVQNAAAVIDKIGIEGEVIKSTFIVSIAMTTLVSILTTIFLVIGKIDKDLILYISLITYLILFSFLLGIEFRYNRKKSKKC